MNLVHERKVNFFCQNSRSCNVATIVRWEVQAKKREEKLTGILTVYKNLAGALSPFSLPRCVHISSFFPITMPWGFFWSPISLLFSSCLLILFPLFFPHLFSHDWSTLVWESSATSLFTLRSPSWVEGDACTVESPLSSVILCVLE